MYGIIACGAYIPRYRLERKQIYKATGWMNPGNASWSSGEKAVANYDEDVITMAVAAAQDALGASGGDKPDALFFASTSMPFKERLNAGIVRAALSLGNDAHAMDVSGGLKSGTSALLQASDGVAAGRYQTAMVCAADMRLGTPSSPQEMIFGDGAAAVVMGNQNVIAELKGSYNTSHDFVDHYRGAFSKFDRQWEERWIRDMGLIRIIPEALQGLLKKYALRIEDFSKIVYPCYFPAARKQIARMLGITPAQEQGNLQHNVGDTGTPHALLMLIHALEAANPGDKILLLSFGNGCDALYFEVTESIRDRSKQKGVSGNLVDRFELNNYTKYLVWRDILPIEIGLRSEEDLWTRWSALWRNNSEVLGLVGSRCTKCGTPQYPPQRICVNMNCNAVDEMEAYCFSDKSGKIASYTGDNLVASYDPPDIYGQIEFEDGGKNLFNFTDCDLESLSTGMSVTMSFRKKYQDSFRDISGYFWKAVPNIKGD